MTRNDYERLAGGLRQAWQDTTSDAERMGVALASRGIADVLAGDNARFDRARFMAAIKVDAPADPAWRPATEATPRRLRGGIRG